MFLISPDFPLAKKIFLGQIGLTQQFRGLLIWGRQELSIVSPEFPKNEELGAGMARRRRQSALEDVVEIASKLPWKVGLALALGSYLVLSVVAGIKFDQPATVGTMGNFMVKQFVVTLAAFGQVLLPFCFLIGAGWSFFKQRKNEQLFQSIATHSPAETKSSALQAVERLTWQEFEMLVGESFRRKGYTVKETGGGGADGGIDLEMSLHGQKYLVQCKQWKAFKVGVKVVREFFGVMVANGAKGGFVVTSGVFTEDAVNFAEDKNIALIDGGKLMKIINGAQAAQPLEKQDVVRQALKDIPTQTKSR